MTEILDWIVKIIEHNIAQQNTFCASLSTSQVLKVAHQKCYNVVFCLI